MRVKMINSVDEYVAGEQYELPDEQADRFVLLGYAEGTLSRDYSDEEVEVLQNTTQQVGV